MLSAAAASGERATKDGNVNQHTRVSNATTPTLGEIGVTRDQSSKWQEVAKLTDAEFEDALETTKAITHEISTPKVLRVVQQARERDRPIEVDASTMPAAIPVRVPSASEQAVAFYNAVRSLGELTLNAAELRAALPFYQHFRIVENVGRAFALLQEVNSTWKT